MKIIERISGIFVTQLDSNQKTIISIMILSTSWLFFLLDNKIWYQLVNYAGNQPMLTQTLFLYSFSIFMFTGTCFIRKANLKTVGVISLLNILLLISLIKFIPAVQIHYLVYILLGVVSGLLYSVIFYIGTYGFSPDIRIQEIAIFLLGTYSMEYFYNDILIGLGFDYLYPVFLSIVLVVIHLFCRVDIHKMIFPSVSKDEPFPWKPVLLLDLVFFILFFISFLVSNGTRVLELSDQQNLSWLSRIIRLAIFGGFYFSKPNFSRVLYSSFICLIMAFVLSIMPVWGDMPLFFSISPMR